MSLLALSATLLLAVAPPGLADRPVVADGAVGPATTVIDDAVAIGEMPPEDTVSPSAGIRPEIGEILVTARARNAPGDPLQDLNVKSFAVAQQVDEALVGPVSLAYKSRVPAPIRSGLRNLLNNLHEPDVFLNFLLQLNPGKAAETLGRFAINSTLGLAGLFDVAKRRPFNLPRRPNGFADSFGFYGVGPGPFLFLPLIGPTTLRDAIGGGLDRLVLPLTVSAPFTQIGYSVPAGVIGSLDRRAEFDDQLRTIRETGDPYTARRELYLRRRKAEIDGLRAMRRAASPPAASAGSEIQEDQR